MDPADLTAALKREALALGFDLAGACPAAVPTGWERFRQWLAAGYAGEMRYMADRAPAYEHPRHVLDGARSILMLGTAYRTVEPVPPGPGEGRVSRYAWGSDYHDLIRDRLRRLADFHGRLVPHARARGVVDTAPLLEREFAQLAGLGWIGKNTLLLSREYGSWLFLAALLTTETLQYDGPVTEGRCGTCRACLDACPTGALVDSHQLDARRCISYLTIELRSPVPSEFREPMGPWLFGCDVCQEACPWNRGAPISAEEAFRPRAGTSPVDLAGLFAMDDRAFRKRFRKTPLWRSKRRGLLQSAAIVLGNRPHEAALPALIRGLSDAEPLVRAACAWALGRYGDAAPQAALRERLGTEDDPDVRREIEAAIDQRRNTRDQGRG